MYQEERLTEIMELLKRDKRISVEQICRHFQVSRDTARRDLVKLEERKTIIRTRGGAILPSSQNQVLDYRNRLQTVSEEKKRIGRRAAKLIQPGETVILDTSTTVQACADALEGMRMRVVTNSIHQAEILARKPEIEIQLIGGQLEKEHGFLYGTSVLKRLEEYHVTRAFIGVVGLSDHGLTLAHEEDGRVKKKMMEQADQVVILADHTKFGVTEFFKFADLEDVDLVITDRNPSKEFKELLQLHEVELVIEGK